MRKYSPGADGSFAADALAFGVAEGAATTAPDGLATGVGALGAAVLSEVAATPAACLH